MCKTAFEKHLDNNNSCYDICLYKTIAKNLDNTEGKIPLLKFHNVTS